MFQLFQVLARGTTGCETTETIRDVAAKHRADKSIVRVA